MAGFAGAGVAGGYVARTAGLDLVGDGALAGCFEGLHHLQYAGALACAEVEGFAAWVGGEPVEGGQVAMCQVHDVDVVAHACAVGGVVVVAEDVEVGALACGYLGDEGHEVVGGAVGEFADEAAGVCAYGVEVAQQGDVPGGVAGGGVAQDFFYV